MPNAVSKLKDEPDNLLVELVEQLESIDTNSPLAELNAVSVSDNNGERIYL